MYLVLVMYFNFMYKYMDPSLNMARGTVCRLKVFSSSLQPERENGKGVLGEILM